MAEFVDPAAFDEGRLNQLLGLATEPGERATVITATGELDMLTAPQLRKAVLEQLDQHPPRLVLDLRGLAFLGSSGLAVFVESLEAARDRGTTLTLVGDSREVLRPLEATGLSDVFEIHPDLETALTAV